MIYLFYLIAACAVVFLSNKASEYVDLLDKKTKLSGAFIGGVMLSAVTSLPELFTSISATVLLDEPGLCIGNILGSNLFNIAVLSILILVVFRSFAKVKIAKSHTTVAFIVFLMYIAITLNYLNILNFDIFTVSVTSIIIIILYAVGVKNMAGDESEQDDDGLSPLSVKEIAVRFVLVSIGIIIVSIIITYITDIIAARLTLGTGLAGAIFLGVATSLPEVSSTIALFRLKNYNIAIGNIIGSNLFNFTILSFADLLYLGHGIYSFSDPKTLILLITGAVAAPFMLLLFDTKNRYAKLISSNIVILCYVLFLAL